MLCGILVALIKHQQQFSCEGGSCTTRSSFCEGEACGLRSPTVPVSPPGSCDVPGPGDPTPGLATHEFRFPSSPSTCSPVVQVYSGTGTWHWSVIFLSHKLEPSAFSALIFPCPFPALKLILTSDLPLPPSCTPLFLLSFELSVHFCLFFSPSLSFLFSPSFTSHFSHFIYSFSLFCSSSCFSFSSFSLPSFFLPFLAAPLYFSFVRITVFVSGYSTVSILRSGPTFPKSETSWTGYSIDLPMRHTDQQRPGYKGGFSYRIGGPGIVV